MNCGVYVRVSTNKQETENQLLQLRGFAATQGWSLTAETEYVDELTGKNSDRPAFQRMFRDASQRKFAVLLFWSLDRLCNVCNKLITISRRLPQHCAAVNPIREIITRVTHDRKLRWW